MLFYMKSNDETSVQNLGWLPVVSLCVFIVAFSLGFGPVPWLMVGELFASDIKGLAGSLTGTLNWFLGDIQSFIQIEVHVLISFFYSFCHHKDVY